VWHGWVVSAGQVATDVGNWTHIKTGTAAMLMATTGEARSAVPGHDWRHTVDHMLDHMLDSNQQHHRQRWL